MYISIGLGNHTRGTKYPVKFYAIGLDGKDYINKKQWIMKRFSTLYYDLEQPLNRVGYVISLNLISTLVNFRKKVQFAKITRCTRCTVNLKTYLYTGVCNVDSVEFRARTLIQSTTQLYIVKHTRYQVNPLTCPDYEGTIGL